MKTAHDALGFDLAEKLHGAQKRLQDRPHVSIRLRFLFSLFLCCCLLGATGLLSIHLLGGVHRELHVLESVEALTFQIQQARRFEKDFFLYGTNLADAQDHCAQGRLLLKKDLAGLRVTAPQTFSGLERSLVAYGQRLERCDHFSKSAVQDQDQLRILEDALREHGSEMMKLSKEIEAGQQAVVERLLRNAEVLPIVFLGLLMLFFVFIGYFFLHALMDPLKRFQAYTRRIAQGDFSLIAPARPYRDEFSDLALAVNRMLAELQANQERGVRAGKLAAVGTITSGIAHELNNPLNNVSITTEALMENFKSLNDDQKWKLLQDIYFETERASEIVKSLLDFTRQEKPDLVPLDPSEIILSTQRLVQNEMAMNNVVFDFSVSKELPRILGAANQLRQVFLNLFINAIQAMEEGGTLIVRASTTDDERLCIDVCDTGAGIPPEVLPHLFVPFFTTKEPGKGTGLGLSVSYSIIKKHAGDIRVFSEVGKGTTFHVCLPMEKGTK